MRDRHAEGSGHAAEDQRVRILQEDEVRAAVPEQLSREPGRVKQCMHVAVPVRFRQQAEAVVGLGGEVRAPVGEARHLALLDKMQL